MTSVCRPDEREWRAPRQRSDTATAIPSASPRSRRAAAASAGANGAKTRMLRSTCAIPSVAAKCQSRRSRVAGCSAMRSQRALMRSHCPDHTNSRHSGSRSTLHGQPTGPAIGSAADATAASAHRECPAPRLRPDAGSPPARASPAARGTAPAGTTGATTAASVRWPTAMPDKVSRGGLAARHALGRADQQRRERERHQQASRESSARHATDARAAAPGRSAGKTVAHETGKSRRPARAMRC